MPRLELPDVPKPLYDRLQQRAAARHVPVDAVALECIAVALGEDERTKAETLERVRRLRESLAPVYLTDDDLRAAREQGRE